MSNLKLIYSKEALPLRDFEIEMKVAGWIKEFNSKKELEVTFCNSLVVDYFRLFVKKEMLDFNEFELVVNDEIITIDAFGKLDKYPDEICSFDNVLDFLLGLN